MGCLALAFAQHRVSAAGSNKVIVVPSNGPQKVAYLQDKRLPEPGSAPLGAAIGASAFSSRREQVLPQGGHSLSSQLPHRCNRRPLGVHDRHLWPPLRYPQKLLICRGIAYSAGGRHVWVRKRARVAFLVRTQEVLPQRGHGLRAQRGDRRGRRMPAFAPISVPLPKQ